MLVDFIFTLISLSLTIVVFLGLDSIIMLMIKKNLKWIHIITSGMLYFTALFAALYFILKGAAGHDMIAFISAQIQESVKAALDNYKNMGASAQDIDTMKRLLDIFLVKTFASWCIIGALFIVFLNYFVVRLYMMKRYGIKNDIRVFMEWYLDEKAMWFLLIPLVVLLAKNLIKSDAAFTTSLNFVMVMGNIYFLIGVSLLAFFLAKFRVPSYFQAGIYFIVAIWPTIWGIIALFGIFDTWFNFRKIEKGGSIWK